MLDGALTKGQGPMIGVKQLDHLNLTVTSLAESERWYADAFDFARVESGVQEDGTPWAILRSGEALLCLYERPGAVLPDRDRRRREGLHGLNHLSFRIGDGAAWEERVARLELPLRWGGRIRYPASTSWYVADPTGYEIEVVLWDRDEVRFGASSNPS